MKKILIAALLLSGLSAWAGPVKVLNAFYDGDRSEFAVNTLLEGNESGFFRTKKLIVISANTACAQGCLASLVGQGESGFAVIVEGKKLATVTLHDSENLLPSAAVGLSSVAGKWHLTLDLQKLSLSGRAEVK